MRLLQDVRKAVREQQWPVTEETRLSAFSFESMVIYRDLRALVDVAVAHTVVAALSRAIGATGKSAALPHELDSSAAGSLHRPLRACSRLLSHRPSLTLSRIACAVATVMRGRRRSWK